MTWATIYDGARRAWRAVCALPAWLWLLLGAVLGVLEVMHTRRLLAAERRARTIEAAQRRAERLAAERAALAQGRRIEARDVATRVHDAAREKIEQDAADLTRAAAGGNAAIADEGNRVFGGKD